MAWNRPKQELRAEAHMPGAKAHVRWAITMLVSVILAALSACFMFYSDRQGSKDAEHVQDKLFCEKEKAFTNSAHDAISFVARGKVHVTTNALPPVIEKADVFLMPKKAREVTLRLPEGIIFTNSFNNFVAEVLTATPGSRFLEFDLDWMEESFKESLNEKIIILPNDPEDVAETKRAVQEAREQILKHVRAGGRVREIVAEARSELNKIADYRDELQKNLNTILIEGNDPQTALDYANEANKMLEEYGAFPLEAPDNVEDALDIMASYKEAKIQEEERLDAERRNKKESSL